MLIEAIEDALEVLGWDVGARVVNGHDRIDARVLWGEPDTKTRLVGMGQHIDPVHRNAAGIGPAQPGDDRHQGGLACAVGAEQPERQ